MRQDRPARTRFDIAIRGKINGLADEYRSAGFAPNAAAIQRALAKDKKLDVPSERWIRDFVKAALAVSASGSSVITPGSASLVLSTLAPTVDVPEVWHPMNSKVDAKLVLPTLAAVIEKYEGARTQLTVREAELIASVRAAVPEIEDLLPYYIARYYMEAGARAADVVALDALLAFAPWTSDKARQRYEKATKSGWIESAPMERVGKAAKT